MLLHCVAKEGSPGARDDLGLLGVHVEGICKPWAGGEEGRGESGKGMRCPRGVRGSEGPHWAVSIHRRSWL